jgi:hypothetical protein
MMTFDSKLNIKKNNYDKHWSNFSHFYFYYWHNCKMYSFSENNDLGLPVGSETNCKYMYIYLLCKCCKHDNNTFFYDLLGNSFFFNFTVRIKFPNILYWLKPITLSLIFPLSLVKQSILSVSYYAYWNLLWMIVD